MVVLDEARYFTFVMNLHIYFYFYSSITFVVVQEQFAAASCWATPEQSSEVPTARALAGSGSFRAPSKRGARALFRPEAFSLVT